MASHEDDTMPEETQGYKLSQPKQSLAEYSQMGCWGVVLEGLLATPPTGSERALGMSQPNAAVDAQHVAAAVSEANSRPYTMPPAECPFLTLSWEPLPCPSRFPLFLTASRQASPTAVY
ncbi:hypothetical protein GGTG_04051 [Gaeumannomyces tritici R3-111a-1]|uniref:Uncharacterized protein n=1 Tax=Gaeumannomyces tritici (strain R3-111a-1) TaxID=644352 RepID=J3NS03_GAET3|nr:hypothetical protein GGTG_04051 [Gaeumannomyces tritici R3-111a-1]EJT78959.1 hypothetical protein GGTG_04051 [Gaeumannomyces tritici R3-111a-1]